MSLQIILGPMFSGKSTYIIRNYDLYKEKMKTIIINYKKDNRYDDGDYICSHNLEKRAAVKLENLEDLEEIYYSYEYFLIDEGHFFKDLKQFTLKLLRLKKKVTIVGLNGDINGNVFSNITSLIPYCDGMKYLTSLCSICKNDNKGFLHIKIDSKTLKDSNEYKLVGGSETYKTVCKYHFDKHNKID